MAYVSMKQLLETGVHFGHQTRRWNPKMRPYIFGARNGIHIVDLQQTVKLFQTAHDAIVDTVARGGRIIFIGTKRQAQETVEKEATRCDMFYMTNRWMGGTLTNFATIRQSIDRLKKIEAMFEDGSISRFTKKEALTFSREAEKLNAVLGGIKNMERLPDMAFIIDPKREDIAIKECRKLNIPIAAVTDTNCDPDVIDYVIPGNDDAIRAIKLFVSHIADACMEGQARRKDEAAKQKEEAAAEKAAKDETPVPEVSPSTKETPAPKPEEAAARVEQPVVEAKRAEEEAAEASQTPEASAPAAKAASETAKPEEAQQEEKA